MTVIILFRESNGFFLFSGKIKPKNKSLKLVITEPFVLYLALHSYLLPGTLGLSSVPIICHACLYQGIVQKHNYLFSLKCFLSWLLMLTVVLRSQHTIFIRFILGVREWLSGQSARCAF